MFNFFALLAFLLTNLHVDSTKRNELEHTCHFRHHTMDIVTEFGASCCRLVVVLLQLCGCFAPDIATIFGALSCLLVAVFCRKVTSIATELSAPSCRLVAVLLPSCARHYDHIWHTLLPFSCRFLP